MGPHVRFHPHHVSASLGCLPFAHQMIFGDQCDGEVGDKVKREMRMEPDAVDKTGMVMVMMMVVLVRLKTKLRENLIQ